MAHVQGKSSSSSTAVASWGTTFTSTVTSGSMIAGFVNWDSDTAAHLTSVTDDKGNTYTIVDKQASSGVGESIASFYSLNITNAPQTVTAHFSPNRFAEVLIDEYSGIATSSAIDGHTTQDQTSPGTGTDAVSSGSITTTADGDLIYGASFDVFNGTFVITSGTGFAQRQTETGGGVYAVTEDKTQSTHGAIAATFTIATNDETISGVMAFKVAATGRTVTSAATLGNFVSSAAFKALDKVASAATLGAFVNAAAFKALDKITSAKTLGAFASTAALKALDKITSATTLGAFTSAGVFGHGGTVTSAATLGTFVNAAALKALDKVTSATTLGAFVNTAALKALDKVASATTIGAFSQVATLLRARQITSAATIAPFTQNATVSTGNPAVASDWLVSQARPRRGR